MMKQIHSKLEAVASRGVSIAQSLLRVAPEQAAKVSTKQIPQIAGIYIWRFHADSLPAYVGVGLGKNGLFQRIASQHLYSNYIKSVLRKAIVAEFGVDSKNGSVDYIKKHLSLAYLPCPEDEPSVVGIAESILIYTLQPKYNKDKK